MILPAQTIRKLRLVSPFSERTTAFGMSYGLSAAGYDVRIAEQVTLIPESYRPYLVGLKPTQFALASTMERVVMPRDCMAEIRDKSTWLRRGLVVGHTAPIEPGWRGYVTLELVLVGDEMLHIEPGTPIAQVVFHRLEEPTEQPYGEHSKYQDQGPGPVAARYEQ
jgi:dCTP deaminase